MSLTTALGIAQNALLTTARRTSIVSQNVTNASNPDYSRRSAVLSSDAPGVRVAEIRRAAAEGLFWQNLNASSSWEAQKQLLAGLDTLAISVNGADNAASPATALGRLQEALQLYATTPSSATVAEGALDAGRQFVRSLNNGSAQIQTFRTNMDVEIGIAVNDLNRLLADFEVANKSVIAARASGRDASDALDQREAILKQISDQIPVSTFSRANDDMVITTADGSTLFETRPRAVSFESTAAYAPGIAGKSVYIDGIPLSPGKNGAVSGRLASFVALRDEVATTLQTQLDEIARGAITAFAETDRTGGGAPPLAGLFTWAGGPALPPAATTSTGLASSISINPAFDSDAGGNPALLRDGGANGAAYVANPGGASYADLLIDYGDRLTAPIAFDPAARLATNISVTEFSSASIGWIEASRQTAFNAELTTSALKIRTAEALSNETGVNIDVEMSLLLDLEHAYEASARLIRTVDQMMATLLETV
ncbi:MAG: flagellar hook-associated protein FlgK [Nitratireductor sp.]